MARKRPPLPSELQRGRIAHLDERGCGILRVGDRPVHVPGALPGELVEYRYLRRSRRFEHARLAVVLEPSPLRARVRCPHFDECGGCTMQQLRHDRQLADKQRGLLDAFASVGLRPDKVPAPLAAPPWGYRRRARLAVREVPRKGGVLVGFREKHGNRIAEMGVCEVLVPAVGRRLHALRELLGGLRIRASIPQIEVAAGDDAVALVVRHLEPLPAQDREALVAFARDSGLQIHLQPGGPDSVHPLEPAAPDPLCYRLAAFALELRFRPGDFIQVNAAVNVALVDRVLAALDPAPGELVLDLFCGIGNFTLPLAARGACVVGVEGDAGLVAQASDNAVRNRLENARFVCADLDQPETLPGLGVAADKLLLDPPRSGAAGTIEALAAPYPARIVYVSCNPATLARDAQALVSRHGYRLSAAGIVDMFPHTAHVEAIGIFTRDRGRDG